MLYTNEMTTEKARVTKNVKPAVKLTKWSDDFKSRYSQVKSRKKNLWLSRLSIQIKSLSQTQVTLSHVYHEFLIYINEKTPSKDMKYWRKLNS